MPIFSEAIPRCLPLCLHIEQIPCQNYLHLLANRYRGRSGACVNMGAVGVGLGFPILCNALYISEFSEIHVGNGFAKLTSRLPLWHFLNVKMT